MGETVDNNNELNTEIAEKELAVSYTPQEEKRIIRKLDFCILPILVITNALDFMDKSVFSIAMLYGMGEDLELTKVIGTSENGSPIVDNSAYSLATMIFFIGYIVGAYPWSILAQKFPAGKVVSIACFIWGVIGVLTPVCTNFSGIMANRFFLGMAESAISPIFSVYICYFWKRDEQSVRNGWWYAAGGLASSLGPIIGGASGLIDAGSNHSWKYMYYIICGVTVAWSFIAFFFLPDDPSKARFLNDRQKLIAAERLKSSQTGSMETKLDFKQIKECFTDHNVYFLILFIFTTAAPGSALTAFSSLVVQGFGFSNFVSLLLLCPLGVMTVLGLLVSSYVAGYFKNIRYYCIFFLLIVELAGALLCWQAPPDNMGARYGGLLLFPFVVSASGMGVALASSNIAGHTKKYFVGSLIFIANSVGSIVGTVLFGASPGPKYNTGFISNAVLTIICIVITIGSRIRLGRVNKNRDDKYGNFAVDNEDEEVAMDDLTDKENKSFRYLL